MSFLTLAQAVREMEEFGGIAWKDQTTLHPLAAMLTAAAAAAVFVLPRNLAILPIFVVCCFVSSVQRVVVFGFDLQLVRLLVLVGLFRVATRGEFRLPPLHAADKMMLAFAIARVVIYTLQWRTVSALIYQFGSSIDMVGAYFLARCLVRALPDILILTRFVAALSLLVAAAFLVEHQTQRNVFAVFGGVSPITAVREGRLRCEGAFAHPIIAGCFWASNLPLFILLASRPQTRLLGSLAVGAALLIVVLCASSTPLVSVIAVAIGFALFPVRHWMRWIGMAGGCTLVALDLVMKASVWDLIGRLTLTSGNTGYHRSQLIKSAISHFFEWAPLGTRSTAHWFWGAQDITNQYILVGVQGGFISLVCFAWAMYFVLRSLNRMSTSPRCAHYQRVEQWTLWVTIFTHAVAFVGVSYFGQCTFLFFTQLGMIASYVSIRQRSQTRRRTSTSFNASAPDVAQVRASTK